MAFSTCVRRTAPRFTATSMPQVARGFASSAVGAQQKVGIVGVGAVGSAIANNLAARGLAPVAFTDLNPDAGEFLKEHGAQYVSTPREVAEASDVVITALTTPPVVRKCVLGDTGVLAGLQAGNCWIDHSTTDYNQTLELNAMFQERGIDVLEAPITGGLTLLKEGKMTVYVGGPKEVYERQRYLMEASFANILYMGEMGTATITKVVTNMLAALHAVSLGEALCIAKGAGIDLGAYFDAVRLSAGNSYVWETEAPLVFNQTFEPGFTIDLHCKDLNLGYEIGRKYNVPLELFGLVEQQYLKAKTKYGDKVGSTSPAKLKQDETGKLLAAPGFEDWSYTVEMVPSSMPGRAPTMAVRHQIDEEARKFRERLMAQTGADKVHTPKVK